MNNILKNNNLTSSNISFLVDKTYILSLELAYSWFSYNEDSPVIELSKPFLVNRNSSPLIISKHIQTRLNLACSSLDLLNNLMEDDIDNPAVIVRYKEINI